MAFSTRLSKRPSSHTRLDRKHLAKRQTAAVRISVAGSGDEFGHSQHAGGVEDRGPEESTTEAAWSGWRRSGATWSARSSRFAALVSVIEVSWSLAKGLDQPVPSGQLKGAPNRSHPFSLLRFQMPRNEKPSCAAFTPSATSTTG